MIDTVLDSVSAIRSLDDVCWVFVSTFDSDGQMLWSHGSLQPTKNLKETVTVLYTSLKPSVTHNICVDIVWDIVEITRKDDLLSLDMQQYGLCVSAWDTSGVMLPWTQGVADAAAALATIKNKHNLTGKVRIYKFTTQRVGI